MPIFWLVAVIVFVIVEGITLGLTSIWFACGSLLAMVVALMGGSIIWQIVFFAIGSGTMLALIRPMIAKVAPKNVKTNADRVIGQSAIVTMAINNEKAIGQVSVAGQIWTARSQDGAQIAEGATVTILSIAGVKVIVKQI